VSEYQYYEFMVVDRPLTEGEMGELRGISTHADITTTSFTNEYSWGDLKASPVKLLQRYFDVFVYVSNWGAHRLGLRIPSDALDGIELYMFIVEVKIFSDRLVVTPRAQEPGLPHISNLDAIAGSNHCSAGAAMLTHLSSSGKLMLSDRTLLQRHDHNAPNGTAKSRSPNAVV
jgi:hypothetical protein